MTTTATRQPTAAGRSALDRAETSVEFDVETFWGLTTVHGRFDRFEGSYEIGPDGPRIELTVDAASLDTGNRTRDKHLRSAAFFDIAAHPQVRFTSTRVSATGPSTLHVQGRLEAAGKVVPVEFDATVRHADGSVEIETTATVDQQRLGMSSGLLGMIRRPTTVRVRARLAEPVAAAAQRARP